MGMKLQAGAHPRTGYCVDEEDNDERSGCSEISENQRGGGFYVDPKITAMEQKTMVVLVMC
jgi:hypothetical protein